jgi:hypothetical protein
VTSTPNGLSCGGACGVQFDTGTVVALTATPATGSVFSGWSGACTGTGGCQVTMSRARSVTAAFDPAPAARFALTVSETGGGNGTVAASVNGVDCGTACGTSFDSAAVVTLTATPGTGSVFAGWSGACSGTGACQVTMSQAWTVTAIFNTAFYRFTIRGGGTGSGSVTSSPSGINCTFIHGAAGSGCAGVFPYGATVSLNPVAFDGNSFAGWSGACSGTASCQVAVPRDTAVTVGFTLLTPGTPTGLVVASRTASTLVLSWRRAAEADLYYLLRSETSGGGYATVHSGPDTLVTDAGLASGTTYYYIVRAWNNAGWSSFSVELTGTTLAGAPSVPTGLAVGSPTASSLQVSWNGVAQATGYQLLRSSSAGGTYGEVYKGAGTSVTDQGLAAGVTYYYRVKAFNGYGYSAASDARSGTTLAGAPPAVPTGLVVNNPTSATLDVCWNASPGATGYELLRSSGATGTYASVYQGASRCVTDAGLAAGTTYYYKVRASNGYGTSDLSDYRSGATRLVTAYEAAYVRAVFGRGGFAWTTNVPRWQSGTIWIRYSGFLGHHIASPAWSRCYDAVLVLDPHDRDHDGGPPAAGDHGDGHDARGSSSEHDRRDGGSWSPGSDDGRRGDDGRGGSALGHDGREGEGRGNSPWDRDGHDEDGPSFFFSEHSPREDMGLDIDPATTSVTVTITGVLEHREPHGRPGWFWTRNNAWNGRFDFDPPDLDCQTLTRTIPVEALGGPAPFRVLIGYFYDDPRFRYWGAGIREVTLTFNGWLVPEGQDATVWRCTGAFNWVGDRDHAYPRSDRDRSCDFHR